MFATILIILCGAIVFTSCNKEVVTPPSPKDYFPSWNQCDALTALKAYVEDVTDPKSSNYINAEDRIATFDMDGTFLGELYPTYFEYNLIEYRVFDDPSYRDKAPEDVRQAAQDIRDFVRTGKALPDHFDMIHARAAAKAYAGMTLAEFDSFVKAYAATPANGFTYYVVSGSDRFVCRTLVEPLGIPTNRIIGMDVWLKTNKQDEEPGVEYTMGKEEYLIRTDSLVLKNIKNNKVIQIGQEIGKVPVLSFGNSSGDCAMHNYCLSNKEHRTAVFMLVADDDVRDHADLTEGAKREAKWREAGYYVISMKNDFKTIYGQGVTKTDFIFN